jgi:hypothetical protein
MVPAIAAAIAELQKLRNHAEKWQDPILVQGSD